MASQWGRGSPVHPNVSNVMVAHLRVVLGHHVQETNSHLISGGLLAYRPPPFGTLDDFYKSIKDITYNHLNLPVRVTFYSGTKIEYFYDATGVKLKKKVTDGTNITTTEYMDT